MTAGLQRNVYGRSARRGATRSKGIDFCVRPAEAAVEPLTDDATAAYDHATDHRVGLYASLPAHGEVDGTLHHSTIERRGHWVRCSNGTGPGGERRQGEGRGDRGQQEQAEFVAIVVSLKDRIVGR